jgi:hypothetical protein
MAVAVLLYIFVGAALAWAWNRAELRRVGLRRVAPSAAAFILAWPALVACVVAIAAVWTRIWRRTHDTSAPAAPSRDDTSIAPFAAGVPEPSHPV